MFGFGKKSKDPDRDYAEGSKLYSKGEYKEAFKLLKKSAESGNAEAMYGVGVMYHDGLGTMKDPSKAVVWWERSSSLGNVKSNFNLYAYRKNCSRFAILKERIKASRSVRELLGR